MLTTKGTKLIWDWHENNWGKLPMVVIYNGLKSEPWFKGKVSFITSVEQMKKSFKNNYTRHPRTLNVTQQYKTYKIELKVTWSEENKRAEIHLTTPETRDFYAGTWKDLPKVKGSKFLEGLLDRIKSTLEIAIPAAEKIVAEEIEAEKAKATAKKFYEDLCEELGVSLYKRGDLSYSYQYGRGRNFGLDFETEDKGTKDHMFYINDIEGSFTLEELKAIIKIVGGNPRAIADRLTSKR